MHSHVMRSYKSGVIYNIMNLYLKAMYHLVIILTMIAGWYIYKGVLDWKWIVYIAALAVVSVLAHYIIVVRCIRFAPRDLLCIFHKDLGKMTVEHLETFILQYYGAFNKEFLGCRVQITDGGSAKHLCVINEGIGSVIKEIKIEDDYIVIHLV